MNNGSEFDRMSLNKSQNIDIDLSQISVSKNPISKNRVKSNTVSPKKKTEMYEKF